MFTPDTNLEELELTYVPPGGGEPVRVATVLVSPTRCYIDLKQPSAFSQESALVLNGKDSAAQRRRVLHEVLERWLLKERLPAPRVQDKPPEQLVVPATSQKLN